MRRQEKINRVLIQITAALIILAFSIWFTANDLVGDALWQVRDGLDQIARGDVSRQDEWTWTLYGKEWVPNSWLWNLMLGSLFSGGGELLTFVWFRLFTCILLFSLMWVVLQFSKMNTFWKLSLFSLIVFAMGRWAFDLRPQMAGYIIATLFLILCLYITKKSKLSLHQQVFIISASGLILLIIWQNFHLTAVLGIAFFALCILILLQTTLVRKILTALAFSCLGFLTLFITPYGVDGVLKTIIVPNQSPNIYEWTPLVGLFKYPNNWDAVLSVLIVMLILSFTLVTRQFWLSVIITVGALAILFGAIRFIPYVMIVVLLALVVLRELPIFKFRRKPIPEEVRTILLVLLMIILTSLITFNTIKLFSLIARDGILVHNKEELSVIPEGQRVFTDFGLGGVIELYRPDLYSMLEGRNDLAGLDFVYQFIHIKYNTEPMEILRCLDMESINVVMAGTNEDPVNLKAAMFKGGWTRYEGINYEIYLRPEFLPVPPLTKGTNTFACLEGNDSWRS